MKMVRRIFQIPADDAEWLDREARRQTNSLAGIIRECVSEYRAKREARKVSIGVRDQAEG